MCEATAPSVFAVADDGLVALLKSDIPQEERVQVESAVSLCPTLALRIEDS